MLHYVRCKNLPYSTKDVRDVCISCRVCAELKPRFVSTTPGTLVSATKPMDRLSVDFKGPLPSRSNNKYMFVAIDEYSRYPFAIPCKDTSSSTVIRCLEEIFSMFGTPAFVHSDRGLGFMSNDVRSYLLLQGVSTSKSTPYHPQGNSQVERANGVIWKSVKLALRSSGLPDTHWETVLPRTLHCIRSLLCTATNHTPHERMFTFERRSSVGQSTPSWLANPGPVLLRNFARQSKDDPIVREVELVSANPKYAHIRYPDGRESSVSLRDVAPMPRGVSIPMPATNQVEGDVDNYYASAENVSSTTNSTEGIPMNDDVKNIYEMSPLIRRSTRVSRPPDRFSPPPQ